MDRRELLTGVCLATLMGVVGIEPLLAAPGTSKVLLQKLPAPRILPKPPGTIFFAPSPPFYPVYTDLAPVTAQAWALSAALEQHIRAWLAGTAPAALPDSILPPGTNTRDYSQFRLVRPEQITAEEQWAIRPADMPMDNRNGYRGFFPDPNCTYIVMPAFYAPFGSRLVIEGSFPHARFFDIQVTPSFDPSNYRYEAAGVGEVPIVDIDIDPVAGHNNPYRPGVPRDVQRRNFRVEYDLAIADPVQANPAFRPPFFRAPGNRRTGGAIMFRGPWGIGAPGGDGRGAFAPGEIWIRYYRPDDTAGPYGGVPLPKAWCELPTGERFWIACDFAPYETRVNRRDRPRATYTEPDVAHGEGPTSGWYKQAGIFRSIVSGIARNTNWAGQDYVRLLDRGVASRASELPPPHSYEQSATSATYIDYLVRGMSCGRGKVVVLSGKLPTFPNTAKGGGTMTPAEMRYWSLVGYAVPEGFDFLSALSAKAVQGMAIHAVRDDELVLDDQRYYVIALSRAQDRPTNARPEAGVTWIDWGPAGKISWTNRWLTVGPQWKGSMIPSPEHIGRRGERDEITFDETVISRNGWDGALGSYLPRIGYMSRSAFESLGTKVDCRSPSLTQW